MALQGKKILLGVTGSIAAYKAASLVRLLIKAGCEVQVLMTDAAKAFISPLTLSTLSKRPVLSEIISDDAWNNHVALGLWADAMVIAPATATTLSKCATAQADSLIVATYLSARCPVYVAPAMDVDMWAHPANARNLELIAGDGVRIIPVGHGELASGLIGDGRMAEPEEIMHFLDLAIGNDQTFAGKRVLITAGPTHEAIDPVRFISNPSTGKMGLAIAEAFAARGAQVTVILGPVSAQPSGGLEIIPVRSAKEMYEATASRFGACDVAIMAAAVADYTPAHPADKKIGKGDGPEHLELRRTKDIAFELGKIKDRQIVVGFALETHDAETHAREKLRKKRFDLIVLNSLEDSGAGFGHDTNKVKFIFSDNTERTFGLKPKTAVAQDICDAVAGLMQK